MALGVLLELAQNYITIPFILTWRKRGKNFIQLLMEIYREEDQKFNINSNFGCFNNKLNYYII